MKSLLTTLAVTGLLLGAVTTANAQVVDPTDLHMTSTGQTGSDPVSLNSNTQFGVTDVPSGGQNGSKDAYDLELILAVPVFNNTFTAPTLGTLSTSMSGVTATGAGLVNLTGSGPLLFGTGSSAKDLYTYLVPPCSVCDNSLNQSNLETNSVFTGLFTSTELANLDGFVVFTDAISFNDLNDDLLAQASLTTAGDNLPLGTYVAALAFESDGMTPLATSFTNTGLVNDAGGGGGSGQPIPEPTSLVVLGTALMAFGFVNRRRKHLRTIA